MQTIKLHSPADTYVGDLQAVEALVWQQINGEHTCRVTVMSNDPLASDIERGCIVLVPDADGTDQRFRISQPVESLDWITLEGAHISQDLAQDMIVNRGWEDSTGQRVWPELLQAGTNDTRFSGVSDIQTVNTVRIVRQSVMASMIGTADNTFINRWGGELQRDNYTLNMLTRLGSDTPHQIAYQHNLLGIEVSEDESAIVNRIVPTAVSADNGVLMLPEQWLDSPRISWTQVPHVRHVHYSDIRVGWTEPGEEDAVPEYPDEASALAEMRARVERLWTQGVDMPRVSARLNVLDLSKTEEYKDYEPALEMRLGDSCRAVYANRVIVQRLVAYRWDALGGEYQEITLGTVEPSLDSELAKWQTIIEERATDRAVERAYGPAVRYTKELNDAIASALGFYRTEMTDETGRTKVYYHDEPELAQSMIIETQTGPGQRAWTDTGWNNGSPVWKYGNTDRGLLVMDIVRARGVSADWINAGTLDANRITVSGDRTLDQELSEIEDRVEGNKTTINDLGVQVDLIDDDLATLIRQHHGLPPPTNYKTGDRWALKAYTNADLSSYTNAQLQAWGVRNAMLSGGELLATRGRTDSYAASDWTWIATSGTELNRIDRLLTDIQAGRIQLSSLTQLPGGGWQIGNFAIHDYDRSRWQHADGSYTQIGSSPGLEQYIAGRGHRYHNLMYITTLSGQDTLTKWVQLPDEFKGKPFEVYVALSDSAEHVEAGGDAGLDNRSAIRRLVTTLAPDAEIDHAEARVPYKCYKLSVDIHNVINEPLEVPWRVTRAVGIMIAIA